jgi:hypothetical protein
VAKAAVDRVRFGAMLAAMRKDLLSLDFLLARKAGDLAKWTESLVKLLKVAELSSPRTAVAV